MNMSYKIAIASADGENINLSFGAAEFSIFMRQRDRLSFP